jgi:Bifunctional DNA primase/polymerase, N-terminal/Primase C terminal 2 (PriCT-2)
MSEISNSPPTRNHGGLLKPIILVACVEAKADKPGKAEDFYRSPYFKKCLTWARSVGTDHCIRIVSGKYGLLRLNDQVEPYDQKLQQSGHLSLQQIASEKEIWFVGGGSYFEKLKVDLPQLRWVFEELPPGADTRGIGRQEVWLVEHLGKLPNVKTTTLDWALFYAKHYGWVSFPAKRGEKSSHKSAEFSTNGQRWGASSDLQQIRHDHQRWPDADLGIPTGNVNGIVVLETDTKAGHPDLEQEGEVTLQQLEAIEQDKVPETLTAISPSGSLHRYFRLPSPIRREQVGLTTIPSMNGKLGPGIDLKGEGGMVIAPPSRGSGYCWVNERPPVELPWWLLRRIADLSSPPSSNNNERREEEYRHLTRRQRAADREVKLIEINAMLAGIHPDIHREAWIQIGCALFRELGAVDGRKVWQSWSGSKGSRKYRAGKWSDQCEKQWASIIKKDYNFTIDTIRHYFKTMAYRPEIYHELMGAFDQQFIDGVNNTYAGALSGEADVICDDPKWSELYDSVDNFFVEWLKKNRKNKDEQNKDEQSDPAPDGGQPKPDPEPAPKVKEEWPTLGARLSRFCR